MIHQTWAEIIAYEKKQPYFKKLKQLLNQEYAQGKTIFPPKEQIFNAFRLTDFNKVKVVILGQDPYHNFNQAHGLAFSVNNCQIPPSLKNIFQELKNNFDDFIIPNHGNLTKWGEQGVLLLNTILTVEAHKPKSHHHLGWQTFSDNIIKNLNQYRNNLVFMLWGADAQKKASLITNKSHLVLQTSHPSPFSVNRGFFGCQHFYKANQFLNNKNFGIIDWQI